MIDVAGVGYRVLITPRHAATLRHGHDVTVITSLIVRDDSLTLFGFEHAEEQQVFDLLLSVSGVGPKSALGVLGALTVDEIAQAASTEDDRPFRTVPGIGPKTAKLIAVSLAGKISPVRPVAALPGTTAGSGLAAQLVVALVGLGWREPVAADAVDAVLAGADVETAPAGELLKRALATLGPAGERGGAA